jgi:HK97 family phage portal protein
MKGAPWRARAARARSSKNQLKPHGILVLEGDATYENVADQLDNVQFAEQRRLATQQVCQVFRIPSHFLNAGTGGDSLTYSTSESMSADFVKYSLTPWLRRIELAISHDRDLTFDRQYVKFEVDGLLRADAKTRAEVYRIALDPLAPWLTVDEIRQMEDLPPMPSKPPAQTQETAIEQMLARPQGVASNGNG